MHISNKNVPGYVHLLNTCFRKQFLQLERYIEDRQKKFLNKEHRRKIFSFEWSIEASHRAWWLAILNVTVLCRFNFVFYKRLEQPAVGKVAVASFWISVILSINLNFNIKFTIRRITETQCSGSMVHPVNAYNWPNSVGENPQCSNTKIY